MSRNQKSENTDNSDAEINAILLKIHEEDQETIKQLIKTIDELQLVIEDLRARLNLNSKTSSFSPSRDLYSPVNKNRSLRKKTDKKVGGQLNHKGSTRKLEDEPDEITKLTMDSCPCGHSLKEFLYSERFAVILLKSRMYVIIFMNIRLRLRCAQVA